MIASPYFYLTISFVAFLGVLYRYAWRPLVGMLDAHIAKVRDTLQQVDNQKIQALQDFEQEAKLYEQVDQHVQEILQEARDQCDVLRHSIKAEIEKETLEQQARLKLLTAKMREDFLCQLSDQIALQIIEKTHQWADTHLNAEVQISSQKKAIELLSKLKPFDHE
ncbi:ATP synthase F0 subunit B [Candidatus Finniella inopinata]|uniref:ATP synthase subunit b n=1 Tax=Candidatus Finniella inopinata TaxID=1696036 RepID=A0A4Q7DHG3_9PROT|nr:hypothetical protein [Candidatus Finniella inopinata]RZI46152.1 hypothetical protein EQU50_04245 [Candidatus Finniella inopinata]